MYQTNDALEEKRVFLSEKWDNQFAIIETKELAQKAGFSTTDQAMICAAASELSTNILRYAGQGQLFLRIIRDTGRVGLEIAAVDKGPGIASIAMAMEDNYSTTKGSLGLGLPSVRRIMDEFAIESSPEQGTSITARKWRTHGEG